MGKTWKMSIRINWRSSGSVSGPNFDILGGGQKNDALGCILKIDSKKGIRRAIRKTRTPEMVRGKKIIRNFILSLIRLNLQAAGKKNWYGKIGSEFTRKRFSANGGFSKIAPNSFSKKKMTLRNIARFAVCTLVRQVRDVCFLFPPKSKAQAHRREEYSN